MQEKEEAIVLASIENEIVEATPEAGLPVEENSEERKRGERALWWEQLPFYSC
jgi:hypothetical protein